MTSRAPPPLAALLTLFVLAGCLGGGSKAALFRTDASNPVVMAPPGTPHFGYDGSGMVAAKGTMTIHVMNAENRGYVAVDLAVPSGPYQGHYQVNWTDFHIQPGATWQDGGIACGPGLVEHGASGQGNKMEPQFDLACGGWGTASATRDGKALADPLSGATAFNAHFMVTNEAMMRAGNKVTKADRTTPFDPHAPGDGYVDPSRMEAHFAMWGTGAYQGGIAVAAPQANATIFHDVVTGPTYAKSYVVPIKAVASVLAIDASFDPPGPTSVPAGQVTVDLKDPSGKVVASGTLSPTAATHLAPPFGSLAPGNWTVDVAGAAAQAAYTVTATVTPPAPFLLHVVFTELRVA
ncbi:MAG: hypothetical protein ACYDBQ_11290 [Thermoplasmatota archaeon]